MNDSAGGQKERWAKSSGAIEGTAVLVEFLPAHLVLLHFDLSSFQKGH
jgi:hypothetical protein